IVRQYRKLDEDFKAGAVRLVFETGKPIAQVARDLGVNEGTLGNWVALACRALGVSQAWFYKGAHGDPSAQHARRAQVGIEVARLFAAHKGRYGAPRIAAELREAGWRVSENTVAALLRAQGLVARPKRRRRSTTRPGRGRQPAPDLIGRDFAAEQLNRKWYADGTEIVTDEGKLYLDSVLDMASRRIVGFALGEHHNSALAYAALAMAVAVRGGDVDGVVLHTDGGSEGGFHRSSQHHLKHWCGGVCGAGRWCGGRGTAATAGGSGVADAAAVAGTPGTGSRGGTS